MVLRNNLLSPVYVEVCMNLRRALHKNELVLKTSRLVVRRDSQLYSFLPAPKYDLQGVWRCLEERKSLSNERGRRLPRSPYGLAHRILLLLFVTKKDAALSCVKTGNGNGIDFYGRIERRSIEMDTQLEPNRNSYFWPFWTMFSKFCSRFPSVKLVGLGWSC